jgi:hypothetical protein
MATRAVDLEGLPEDQARAIEEQARYWRELTARKLGLARVRDLPRWTGIASPPAKIRRREIYDDVG